MGRAWPGMQLDQQIALLLEWCEYSSDWDRLMFQYIKWILHSYREIFLKQNPFLPQVTSMIATGPKPPLSFNSSNDEAPIKLDIGGGMGELRNVEHRYVQCSRCAYIASEEGN